MGYSYAEARKDLFTEVGQVRFVKGRDVALHMIQETGAFRLGEWMAKNHIGGDTWEQMAVLDRMVELGELVKLREDGSCWAQYQVFTTPQVHNR